MNESEFRAIGAAEPGDIRCSFCGEGQREVATIVTARAAFICDECTGLCIAILAERCGETLPNAPKPSEGEEVRRRLFGELARRRANENEQAQRRALAALARRLAEGCRRDQGLPNVIGQLAMTLAHALDPERHPDVS